MKNPAITVTNLTVRYGDKIVLEDVTLEVPNSSICGLVGMNGAGKSTLFKTIMGVVSLNNGAIKLHGTSVKAAQKKGVVAYVPQGEDIDWDFPVSVWDVVMMGRYRFLNLMRSPRQADNKAVQKALDRVHLSDLADRQIGQLSGGQRKRVFVARALAQGASILLLDEPFAGVDAKTETSLVALLQELKTQNVTTLITAHDLNTVGTYCDRMILLNRRVIAAGPTKKVFTPENIATTYGIAAIAKKGVPWTI